MSASRSADKLGPPPLNFRRLESIVTVPRLSETLQLTFDPSSSLVIEMVIDFALLSGTHVTVRSPVALDGEGNFTEGVESVCADIEKAPTESPAAVTVTVSPTCQGTLGFVPARGV